MQRRAVALGGGLWMAWAGDAAAQAKRAARQAHLGWLSTTPATTAQWQILLQGLAQLGWVEGRNLTIERRHSQEQQEQFDGLAMELIQQKVDLVIASGTQAALAVQRVSPKTPVVFFFVGDAVGVGLVASLPRPGGTATGFGGFGADVHAKQVQLMRELLPKATKLGVLVNPDFPMHRSFLSEVEAAAKRLQLSLVLTPLRSAQDIDTAFATLAREHVAGALILSQPKIYEHGAVLAQRALERRLPTVTALENLVYAGVLMSYGWRLEDDLRRVPVYVDRILRGTPPAALPVEQPSRFYLTLNLRTAHALGLQIPQALRLRADEVIE